MRAGDNARTSISIGSLVGLDVRTELVFDAKLAAIAAYRAEGPIALGGDGINDARRSPPHRSASRWAAAPMLRWRPPMSL